MRRKQSTRAIVLALASSCVLACGPAPAATGPAGSAVALASAPSSGPRAAPGATLPPPTALQAALAGINDDGMFSKETALAAFVASFGPLPGVTAPTSNEDVADGTLAIDMVAAHWSELTDAQRAAIRDWIGADDAAAISAAYRPGALDAIDRAAVDQAAAEIAAHVGHPLTVPIVLAPPTPKEIADAPPAALAWAVTRYDATGRTPIDCRVSVEPRAATNGAALHFTLLHEIWHCYQGALLDRAGRLALPEWIKEGQAQWVAESITNGVGAIPGVAEWWIPYILEPKTPLLKRTYDAVGFFAQLDYTGNDPWPLLEPMVSARDSHKALEIAHVDDPSFLDRWGSSWFRDGLPSGEWAMTGSAGILPRSVAAQPEEVTLADGGDGLLAAPALATAVARLHTTAFVTHVETIGSGRVADPGATGLDEKVDDGELDLCTDASGDCRCPPGTEGQAATPRTAPQDLRVAATGKDGSGAQVILAGISRDDWCKGGLDLVVDGTINGQATKGRIVGFGVSPPELTCVTITSGDEVVGHLVRWHGAAAITQQSVSGEFDFKFGTWQIGSPDAEGNASFELNEPFIRLGASSGSITVTPTGGKVAVTFANGPGSVTVTGSWACTAV